MKLKFSLLAVALLGLMAAMPVVGHANEAAPQSETRVLTEQEMQGITGAGKKCSYAQDCSVGCVNFNAGDSQRTDPVTYFTCDDSFLPGDCSDNLSLQCGVKRHFTGSDCTGYRTVLAYPCTSGCSGTTCPAPPIGR